MFMADAFISGTQITSIQIGNGNLETNNLHFYGHEEEFDVDYSGIYYCESHPEAFADVTISVYQDRIIQFLINPIDDFIWKLAAMLTQEYFTISFECIRYITIKYSQSIFTQSIFTSIPTYFVVIDHELSSLLTMIHTQLSITPSFRCRAQTTENNCTTMSTRRVPCAWCPGTNICVLV
ncbi:Egg protein isoform 2, partial [Schistosoma japonicum]